MKLFLAALVLTSSVSAFASKCDDMTSTIEIRMCLAKELEKEDKRLNVVYGKLVKKLDKVGQTKLRNAQRAWIAFRDAECEYSSDEMRGGTFEVVLLSSCHVSMTKERADQLQDSVDFR